MQIYTYDTQALPQPTNKSLTHLYIQHALKQMLAPEIILLEHRFPQIKRIADVVWPAQKLIFEVQVSPISADEIRERNRDYSQVGYRVIWILHDHHFNRFRVTEAELCLRSLPHYFTNLNTLKKGIFYDQYSLIRFKRRVKRTQRFPVQFNQVIPVDIKQLPRQFPRERKIWPLSFNGDLLHRPLIWSQPKKKPLFRFVHLYRVLFHLLLEKTTY